MMQISCPHCGSRDYVEFTYGGDATVRRPLDPGTLNDEEWASYLYMRSNTRGIHDELWQHTAGCRCWIVVRRDTYTHDIHSITPATARNHP